MLFLPDFCKVGEEALFAELERGCWYNENQISLLTFTA